MKVKRIIVGCESSQTVTKALREKGYEAWSCDYLAAKGGHPEWHFQGDILEVLANEYFDFGIFHPPCTFLTNASSRWLYNDDNTRNIERWENMIAGAKFFKTLLEWPLKYSAVENPVMHKYALRIIGRRPNQIIQPWQYGHTEMKGTCLWLNNLPKLRSTKNVYHEMQKLPKSEQQKIFYMSPGPDRWEKRSVTYDGIAAAMSDQWLQQAYVQHSMF
jgi:hypothetical protein